MLQNPNHPRFNPLTTGRERREGSALVMAVLFIFIVGIASASYLKLASTEHRSAVRASLYSSSLNLAESGIEMGIEALISGSVNSSTWKKTVTGYLQDSGFSGDVSIVIVNANQANPVIYAEGTISGHPSGAITKQVRVEVSSGFSPYVKGFSARDGITFSGNGVLLDSYNSNYGAYDTLLGVNAPTGYGVNGYNKNDDIFVASDRVAAVGTTAIDQGNADVYGYVTVSPTSTVNIGPNGVVTTYGNGSHDATRVLSDFYADFPFEAHPSGSYSSSYSRITGATRIIGSSNKASPSYYDVSEIALSGRGSELEISGHVVLVMSGDISVTGKGGINIASGGSLEIYTADDVNIAGNGVTNSDGIPSDFFLYGTATNGTDNSGALTPGQSIKISGNGQLAASVYAPAADVTLNGGGSRGDVMGGVVAFTASVTGGSAFHFDEALRDLVKGGGVYSIDSWLEMTGATVASTPEDLSRY